MKRSCTSQRPFQAMMLDVGLAGDVAGQELVGDQDHPVDAPHRGAASSTTWTALALVQQMSVSAFTSAVVFT